jgi:diguanylate cyclase (GGDEF)-like protein
MATRADPSALGDRHTSGVRSSPDPSPAASSDDQARRIEELVSALEEERRTAGILLDLAHSLAQGRNAEDVARLVAAATLKLMGVVRASVFLFDEVDESFSVAGSEGWTEEHHGLFDGLVVRPSETPVVGEMVARPQLRVFRRDEDDPFVRTMLEDFGSEVLVAVPIVAKGRLIGVIVTDTSVGDPPFRPDEDVGERLRGLADQAATALENVRLVDQIRRLAFIDDLTGLPNHLLFRDRAAQAVARAERHGERAAVLLVDLDRFKKVNDSLGHEAGDALLRQVAGRLGRALRAQDTVARTGADEFTILLPGLEDMTGARTVAEKILTLFADPFQVARHVVFMTASVGLALYPDHGFSIDALMRNADMAMYRAKERGRNTFQWYADGMTAKAQERLELEAELHRALDHQEFEVHYQPIFDLELDEMVGVEALVRWRHPGRGLLTPDRFLALAEETGLVVAMDSWVLRAACGQVRRWRDDGLPLLRLAVNISGRTFQQPWLAETVMRVLDEHGLPPDLLELEVSENVAGHEAAETLTVLERLRALGVRVAIDDFGTGYSVLSRLQGFPVNTLKVDKTFVQDITSDVDEGPIVAGLIAMAHRLEVEVTAEGVETPEQLLFLRHHGCDNAQGFLLGRPVKPNRIPEVVDRGEQVAGATAADSRSA